MIFKFPIVSWQSIWKIVKSILMAGIVIVGIVIIISFLLYFDLWAEKFFGKGPDSSGQLLRLCLTGLVALGGIGAFWGTMRRANAAEKTAGAQLDQNKTSRFNQAIEQLGNSNPSVRMGGIYTLHSIAKGTEDSSIRENICNIICSYVRHRSKSLLEEVVENIGPNHTRKTGKYEEISIDIESICKFLFSKETFHIYSKYNKVLNGAVLKGLTMRSPIFTNCSFKNAVFSEAELFMPIFSSCKISDAYFINVHFTGSSTFEGCDIERCFFNNAEMQNAEWKNNMFIEECHFDKGDFGHNNFSQMSHLLKCSFKGSSLNASNFNSCIISDTNFSLAQLDFVSFDRAQLIGSRFLMAKKLSKDQLLNCSTLWGSKFDNDIYENVEIINPILFINPRKKSDEPKEQTIQTTPVKRINFFERLRKIISQLLS